MELKIIKNPNEDEYNEITQAVIDNDNYCPCLLERNANTKCPCKEFREQQSVGSCHCGRYFKVEK